MKHYWTIVGNIHICKATKYYGSGVYFSRINIIEFYSEIDLIREEHCLYL